jgi:hypothetical protein
MMGCNKILISHFKSMKIINSLILLCVFSTLGCNKANDRIILYFDDRENPFGYFSLKGILD